MILSPEIADELLRIERALTMLSGDMKNLIARAPMGVGRAILSETDIFIQAAIAEAGEAL